VGFPNQKMSVRLFLRPVVRRLSSATQKDDVSPIYTKLRKEGRVTNPADKQRDGEERFKRALEYKYAKEQESQSSSATVTAAAAAQKAGAAPGPREKQDEELPSWLSAVLLASLAASGMVLVGLTMRDAQQKAKREVLEEQQKKLSDGHGDGDDSGSGSGDDQARR
jgi:hypothetical protein